MLRASIANLWSDHALLSKGAKDGQQPASFPDNTHSYRVGTLAASRNTMQEGPGLFVRCLPASARMHTGTWTTPASLGSTTEKSSLDRIQIRKPQPHGPVGRRSSSSPTTSPSPTERPDDFLHPMKSHRRSSAMHTNGEPVALASPSTTYLPTELASSHGNVLHAILLGRCWPSSVTLKARFNQPSAPCGPRLR